MSDGKAIIYRRFTVQFPVGAMAWLRARGLHGGDGQRVPAVRKNGIRICLSPENAKVIAALYNRSHMETASK